MRLLPSIALVLLAASCISHAEDSDPRAREAIRLDAEIQRAGRSLLTDPVRARPAVVALLERAEAFDQAAAAIPGESDHAQRKRTALRGPLHNLRLALDQPALASRALPPPPDLKGLTLAADSVSGNDCLSAIELVPGETLRIEVAAGQRRWLTLTPPKDAASPLAVSTVGSEIDATLDVYLDCREVGKPAAASADDTYGLQAIVPLPAVSHSVVLALGNDSDTGIATVAAVSAVTISGRVTRSDTGAPIGGMRLEAYQGNSPASTAYVGTAYSLSNGDYQLTTHFSSVGPHTYLRTRADDLQWIDEAWSNIPCPSSFGIGNCGPGTPGAVATGDGASVPGIDFALSPGATITGQVRDRSGNPLMNASVSVTRIGDPSWGQRSRWTDGFGRFRIAALPDGAYRAIASATGHLDQVFRDIDCEFDCGQIAGTPINAVESTLSQASFSLARAASIRVSVTVDGEPASSYLRVEALNAAGSIAASTFVGYGEIFAVLGPLPAGSYRIRVSGDGVVPEYFQDVTCAQTCGQAEFLAATEVSVGSNAPPVEISMDLAGLPEITGTVTSVGGAPIGGARVTLVLQFMQDNTDTDAQGRYRLRPRATGNHAVHVASDRHIDEVHDNISCQGSYSPESCPSATLVPIVVGVVPQPIDFELAPSARVSGRVNNLPANDYFSVTPLNLANQGIYAGSLSNQGDGSYQIDDLPAGAFRFGLYTGYGIREISRGVYCAPDASDFSTCPTAGATTVTLVSGAHVGGVDFDYRSRNGRRGRVVDRDTGAPLAGIIIDVFDSQSLNRVRSAITNADGRFDVDPLYTCQNCFVATDNYVGYRNEIFDGVQCGAGSAYSGSCSFAGATLVAFPGDRAELLIDLARGAAIFVSGFE